MNNQNNNPSMNPNLRAGDMFTGRVAKTLGKIVRVVGTNESGRKLIIEHKDTGEKRPCSVWHLFGAAYMPMSRDEAVAIWGNDIEPTPLTVTEDPESLTVASPRSAGKKNGHRAKPTTRAYEPRVEVSDSEPAKAPAAASAFIAESITRPTILHFGPDLLPAEAHQTFTAESGQIVRIYKSQIDGSEWGVLRDVAKLMGIPKRTASDRAAKAGADNVVKVAIARGTGATWLIRITAAQAVLDPDENVNAKPVEDRAPAVNAKTQPETVAREPMTAIVDMMGLPATIPHFGPEPLPADAHELLNMPGGHTVRLYRSQRDGSSWAMATDVAQVLGVNRTTLAGRARSDESGDFVRVEVRSHYKNRVIHAWLVRREKTACLLVPGRKDTEEALPTTTASEPTVASQPEQTSEPDEAEADGEVPDGVAIVRIDGVSLVAPAFEDASHMVRDVDLAKFINCEARFLRRQVRKYEETGDLNGVSWRDCEARQLTNGSGVRIFTVKSAFLTMDQALFIVAKSNSPSTNALTRHIISVFLKVQRGVSAGHTSPDSAALREIHSTMARVISFTTETARETKELVLAALSELRSARAGAPSVDSAKAEQDARDAETLRRQRSNAAHAAVETKDVGQTIRETHDTILPLIHRFFTERMVAADMSSPQSIAKCLRPHEVLRHFNAFLASPQARISGAERDALSAIGTKESLRMRVIYSLFNEASLYVKAEKEVEDEDGDLRMVKVLPWYPKVSLVADPRQTSIPGVSR